MSPSCHVIAIGIGLLHLPQVLIGYLCLVCYVCNSLSGQRPINIHTKPVPEHLAGKHEVWGMQWQLDHIIHNLHLYKHLILRLLHLPWLWPPWSRHVAPPRSSWMTSRVLSSPWQPWLLTSVTSLLTFCRLWWQGHRGHPLLMVVVFPVAQLFGLRVPQPVSSSPQQEATPWLRLQLCLWPLVLLWESSRDSSLVILILTYFLYELQQIIVAQIVQALRTPAKNKDEYQTDEKHAIRGRWNWKQPPKFKTVRISECVIDCNSNAVQRFSFSLISNSTNRLMIISAQI